MSTERYENPLKNDSFNPLKLLYITKSKYEDDWHSTLHAHQCSEIFYIVSGQGEFHVGDSVFPVKADQLVIINSNVVHTESSVPLCSLEYIVMGVEGCDFLLTDNEDCGYCNIDCSDTNKDILQYMELILAELEGKKTYYNVVARNLLEILSVKLLRHNSVVLKQTTTSKSSIQLAFVKRYLDNNYKEDITLDLLAKIAHLNKYYLSHLFKKAYGTSPIHYLVQRRITESRHLLAQTDYPISEIALMLGFSSYSYFSQSFNRIETISPQKYRQRAKSIRQQ
ncbi:helix-turn-helix domain-containing protein [Paenibacillus sp. SAF-054]|uniref:helix-turn-helix domain-containing protein n=1 Tax=unclassified Paenibacillus TaxID=185978 RepID=UPI003F7EFD3D